MLKRITGILVVVAAAIAMVVAVPVAFSQMEQSQPVYTFVSQFQVPRANWAAYSEDSEKTIVPIMEKLAADGTLVSWSTFEQIVHTPDGYTHGAAWTSTTISGLMKVLDEVRKAGPRPGQIAATKHEDLLLQTRTYHAGSGTAAYLRVICSNAKPRRRQRAAWSSPTPMPRASTNGPQPSTQQWASGVRRNAPNTQVPR